MGGPYVVRVAADDQIAYRGIGPDLVNLLQEADREATGVGNPTRVRYTGPSEKAKQGALSGSFAGHASNRLASTETETDAVKEHTSAVAHGDTFCVDQIA